MPLERDEGEYAYAGQLILQGIPPYQLAYSMKLPGTAAAYAMILAALGQTASAVHLGLIFVNAATSLLVFFLAARLFGFLAGAVACTSYALLSANPAGLGLAGHASHFVVLPAIAGVLLLLDALESNKTWLFFCSGLLLGLCLRHEAAWDSVSCLWRPVSAAGQAAIARRSEKPGVKPWCFWH